MVFTEAVLGGINAGIQLHGLSQRMKMHRQLLAERTQEHADAVASAAQNQELAKRDLQIRSEAARQQRDYNNKYLNMQTRNQGLAEAELRLNARQQTQNQNIAEAQLRFNMRQRDWIQGIADDYLAQERDQRAVYNMAPEPDLTFSGLLSGDKTMMETLRSLRGADGIGTLQLAQQGVYSPSALALGGVMMDAVSAKLGADVDWSSSALAGVKNTLLNQAAQYTALPTYGPKGLMADGSVGVTPESMMKSIDAASAATVASLKAEREASAQASAQLGFMGAPWDGPPGGIPRPLAPPPVLGMPRSPEQLSLTMRQRLAQFLHGGTGSGLTGQP